jgi:hypothetical protein
VPPVPWFRRWGCRPRRSRPPPSPPVLVGVRRTGRFGQAHTRTCRHRSAAAAIISGAAITNDISIPPQGHDQYVMPTPRMARSELNHSTNRQEYSLPPQVHGVHVHRTHSSQLHIFRRSVVVANPTDVTPTKPAPSPATTAKDRGRLRLVGAKKGSAAQLNLDGAQPQHANPKPAGTALTATGFSCWSDHLNAVRPRRRRLGIGGRYGRRPLQSAGVGTSLAGGSALVTHVIRLQLVSNDLPIHPVAPVMPEQFRVVI